MPPDCPSEATLRLLGSDYLGDTTFSAIETHVESCERCRAVLEHIVRDERECDPPPSESRLGLPELPGFVVERELGRGSAGVVYLASEPGLERHVALKLVPGGVLAGPRQRGRWIAEARAVSRLRHPNIVRLYRVDETEHWLAMVFEFIPGGTLKEHLGTPLDPGKAARLIEIVARATAHIHEKGLLHLDLKPSNILLDGVPGQAWEEATPKISDFGIARADSDPTQSLGSLIGPRGTPCYMSPEQAEGRPGGIGPASDIHALGAILYEMLTGRPPFRSDSLLETLERIRRESPPPPRRLRKEVPRGLDAICRKALERDPKDRHVSALSLADDLRAWREGRPISHRVVRRVSSRAGIGVGGLVVAVGLVLWMANGHAFDSIVRDRGTWIRRLQSTTLPVSAEELDGMRRSVEYHTELLLRDPSLDADGLASIAILERRHSDVYMHEGKARAVYSALLDSSVGLLSEALRRRPGYQEYLWELALCEIAAAGQHGEFDPSRSLDRIAHARRAAGFARRMRQQDRRLEMFKTLTALVLMQGKLTKYLGEPELARRMVESGLEILDLVEPTDAETADIVSLRRLMSEQSAGVTPLFASPEFAGDASRRRRFADPRDYILPESIAGPLEGAILRMDGPFVDGTPAEQAAEIDRVFAEIRRGCLQGGTEPDLMIRAVGVNLLASVSGIGAKERIADHRRHAEGIARGYTALCEKLTTEYPENPDAFRALSEAHIQMAKNAWHAGLDNVARGRLVKARDAARRAASLAPQDPVARALVDDRERRLARALGEMRDAGRVDPVGNLRP